MHSSRYPCANDSNQSMVEKDFAREPSLALLRLLGRLEVDYTDVFRCIFGHP